MKRSLLIGAFYVLAAGCSPTDDNPEKQLRDEAPTFEFSKADLYRQVPNDICRQRDPKFLEKLMARVDAALPVDGKGSAQFESFFVQKSFDGKSREGVLRFTADYSGVSGAQMFAIGSFDPNSCAVGVMKGTIGSDIYRDAGSSDFLIS